MAFDAVVSGGFDDFAARGDEQGAFAFEKRTVVAKPGNQLQIAFLELLPGKSAFPYHFHDGITEAYVILAGTATVRTPEGDRIVTAGQVIAFPPGPAGAHRITNTGDAPLRYVDLDTTSDPDVYHYPDSGKTGYVTYRTGHRGAMHRDTDAVPYYADEPDAGAS